VPDARYDAIGVGYAAMRRLIEYDVGLRLIVASN